MDLSELDSLLSGQQVVAVRELQEDESRELYPSLAGWRATPAVIEFGNGYALVPLADEEGNGFGHLDLLKPVDDSTDRSEQSELASVAETVETIYVIENASGDPLGLQFGPYDAKDAVPTDGDAVEFDSFAEVLQAYEGTAIDSKILDALTGEQPAEIGGVPLKMSQCNDCGYQDILKAGVDCPHCDDGTMQLPEAEEVESA